VSDASFVRYRTSGNAPSPVPFPVPSFTQQQWTVPFDVSYEIDLWGRVRRSFEAAQQLALGAEAARRSVLLTLQADVAATYFSLQSTTRAVDLLQQAIQLRNEAVQIFQQRLEAGIGSEFEVQRGRTEAAVAEAQLQAAKRGQAEFLNALAVLCGQAPSNFHLQVTTNEFALPAISPGIPSAVLERRPDIARAERELAARLAEIGVATTAFFPSVHLTASGGFLSGEVSDLFAWDSRIWSIGPGITVPIFQGGRNRAGLERARAAYDESVAIYRQKVLTAFKEVEDSLAGLQFLSQEVEARRQAAEAATQAAKLSFERYRAGAIAFLELIDSENARLQNELLRVRAANEQSLATVRLVKALGGGWDQ
jgi:multidrug efflux system outer membrane protein